VVQGQIDVIESGRKIDLQYVFVLDVQSMEAFSRRDCIAKFVIGPSVRAGLVTDSTLTTPTTLLVPRLSNILASKLR
jgi:hypothetical protein